MKLTLALLATIAGGSFGAAQTANAGSIIAGLQAYGETAGLLMPHRLAQFVPQVAHESARFVYDKEVWDGKGAQARYDIRTDLGNTPERDGDGYLYRGRSGIQLTGKANYQAFTAWCAKRFKNAPDFVAKPGLINTDPWEGLVPIWYWETRQLNTYADAGNTEMVSRRINGGTNGLDDRLLLYTRTGLTFLGYRLERGVIRTFQAASGLKPDDIDGPQTRKALHLRLVDLGRGAAQPAPAPSLPVAAEMPDEGPIAGPAPDVAGAIAKLEGALADLRAA